MLTFSGKVLTNIITRGLFIPILDFRPHKDMNLTLISGCVFCKNWKIWLELTSASLLVNLTTNKKHEIWGHLTPTVMSPTSKQIPKENKGKQTFRKKS